MIEIEHLYPECTGDWRLYGSGDERRVQCNACGSSYPATPEIRLAAIDENYAGIYGRRAAAAGFAVLEAERDEKKREDAA